MFNFLKRGFVKELLPLYISHFFYSLEFTIPIIVLFMLNKGLTLAEVGLLSSVVYVISFLTEYPTGIIADKYGTKKSVFLSYIFLFLYILIMLFSNNFYYFLFAHILIGLQMSFASGASDALWYDSLKELKKQKLMKDVMGFTDAIRSLGLMISAIIGAFLYSYQKSLPFILSLIFIGIAVICFSFVKQPKYESYKLKKLKFISGFKHLFSKKTLIYLFLIGVTLFLFEHAWYETKQPLLVNAGMSISILGILVAIGSIIGIIGGLLLPKLVHILKAKKSILFCILFQAVGFISIYSNQKWIMAIGAYSLYISHITWNYVDADLIHKHIPSKIRASTLSARQMLGSLIYIPNPWLMAWLVQIYSTKIFLIFAILVVFINMIVFYFGKRYYK
ncbi:MAG: MFS transporter [Candidatus Nanoarchaeia archaeon]|nr:MFS transporter [Candidatus Nanoarchaeia archaeon]